MEMYIKDNGLMIRPMEKEYIFIKMEQNMKVNGEMIYKMEKEYKFG